MLQLFSDIVVNVRISPIIRTLAPPLSQPSGRSGLAAFGAKRPSVNVYAFAPRDGDIRLIMVCAATVAFCYVGKSNTVGDFPTRLKPLPRIDLPELSRMSRRNPQHAQPNAPSEPFSRENPIPFTVNDL